jgi:hypothetical protein
MPTLASLFNQSSKQIYNKFSPDENQLVAINPTTRGVLGATKDTIKYDTQALPISSVVRDAVRISKLYNPFRNPKAILLIGKQYVLQSGNTFQQTRLYNPLSPIVNVVPFLHTLRSRKPEPYVFLQSETINELTTRFGAVITTVPVLENQNVINQHGLESAVNEYSRPEFRVFYQSSNFRGPSLFLQQETKDRGSVKLTYTKATPDKNSGYQTEFLEAAKLFKQRFDESVALKAKLIKSNRKWRLRSSYIQDGQIDDNADNPTNNLLSSGDTNIVDGYNLFYVELKERKNSLKDKRDRIDYSNIITPVTTLEKEGKTDIIKFIFSEAGGPYQKPVQFRALLSSIKESIKTEFNEQRYVGRTERFVTYGGAKRGVNLTFNIVAFSAGEIQGVWSRVNYLSGLAFPKEVKNGFMVPPLFNITVGGIYDNQPCYIETLDYNFLDDTTTFDIEMEVPFAINVTMQLSLLEKSTKFHNSPFYKITEDVLTSQLTAEKTFARFQNQITPPAPTITLNKLVVPPTAQVPLPPPFNEPTTDQVVQLVNDAIASEVGREAYYEFIRNRDYIRR